MRSVYVPPHVQLRGLAQKARAEGVPFDEFWERAVPQRRSSTERLPTLPRYTTPNPPSDTILWPRESGDCKLAYDAIVSCRDAWRRAYEGMPQLPGEAALSMLAPVFGALGDAEPVSSPPAEVALASVA